MAVHHHNRQLHNFLKNNAHPYYSKKDRTLMSTDSTPESNVLQGLSRLLVGCRSLYASSAGYYQQDDRQTCKAKRELMSQQKNDMWVFRMSMQGFKSENVNISVKEQTVLVKAKFDQRQAKEGNDQGYGMTRTIAIPDTVVREKVVGYMDDKQVLVIEAPYKVTKYQKDQVVPGLRRTSSSDGDDEEQSARPSSVLSNECEVPKRRLSVDSDRLSENSNDSFSTTSRDSTKVKRDDHDTRTTQPVKGNNFRLSINMQNVPSKYIEVSIRGRKLIVRCNIHRQLAGLSLKESYTTEYGLPSNVDMDGLRCVRSVGGILTVTAPCLNLCTEERRIEIIEEDCC